MCQTKLSNCDSQVFVNQNLNLHQANIGLYFKGGPLYENMEVQGISHLLEHLCFRRLNTMDQKTLYQRINQIGAIFKGITYFDCIRFDISVSSRYFREAFDIISNILLDFSWSVQEIQAEKKVVIKQIECESFDSFEKDVDNRYFRKTHLSWPIMGTVDSINCLSNQIIQQYKDALLQVENCCCVLTGNFSDQDLEYVYQKMISIPRKECIAILPNESMPIDFGKRLPFKSDHIIHCDGDISDVMLTFDVDLSACSEYEIRLLSSILVDGDGAQLSMILREENGLTNEVYSRIDRYNHFIRFDIIFSCLNEDLLRCLNLVFEVVANSKTEILQNDYLANILFFTQNQTFDLDCPRELNFRYAWHRFILNEKEWSVDQEILKYETVQVPQLQACAAKIFIPRNLSIFVTSNLKYYKKNRIQKELDVLRQKLN